MIYLISGKDKFRRQHKITALKKSVFKDEDLNGFNYQELKQVELNDFCASIQTPAFGAGAKMILIKDFSPLEKKAEDADVEKICNSLKNKPQDNIVVFDSDKILGTLKLVKKIKKDFKDIVKEEKCEPFNSWDLKEPSQWLIGVAKNLDTNLDYQVAEYIVEQIGSEDTAKLYSEVNRLVSSGKELSIENLKDELVGKTDVFKFSKHIIQNQKAKAIEEFQKIVKAKELNIGLLALLETMISNSLKLKLAEKKYRNKNELAGFLGISPGRLYYQQQEVARVSVDHLNNCLGKLLDIERKVKRGQDQLERALVRDLLCS